MSYYLNHDFRLMFEVKKIMKRNAHGFTFAQVKFIKTQGYDATDIPNELPLRGFIPACFPGDVFEAVVRLEEDYRTGYYVYIVNDLHTVLPSTKKELVNFMKKKTKGIGKETLEAIVDTVGLDVITILNTDPDRILAVKNMTKKKLEQLVVNVGNQLKFEELLLFFNSVGISSNIASKVYAQYDVESMNIILHNPYKICAVNGVDFSKADIIAKSSGWKYDRKERVKSAVLSCIDKASANNGDVCIAYDVLIESINPFLKQCGAFNDNVDSEGNLLELHEGQIRAAITELKNKNRIVFFEGDDMTNYVYRKSIAEEEQLIAEKVVEICSSKAANGLKASDADAFLELIEKEQGKQLSEEQKNGVRMGISNRLSILTGGPGTGKTFTVDCIVKCFKWLKPDAGVTLLAPTGKASHRMAELTKLPATTIHRGIGLIADTKAQKKTDLIESDLIIVDESSMIDEFVFSQLVMAVPEYACVVLVGDVDQLPSVGPGAILSDLIESGVVPTTRLQHIFRQAEQSPIVKNAHALLRATTKDDVKNLDFKSKPIECSFVGRRGEQSIQESVVQAYERALNKLKYNVLDVCVLTPVNGGLVGTKELNRALQTKVNPAGPGKSELYISELDLFRVGDKVIHIKNNTELGVVNGDTGIVTAIGYSAVYGTDIVEVEYPDKDIPVCYYKDLLEELELAYAMTVHKSQGSEYSLIIMPFVPSTSFMMTKKLVYTAWTRAKKTLLCIGSASVLAETCQGKQERKRCSNLICRINRIVNGR